jgi:hypothetical protein
VFPVLVLNIGKINQTLLRTLENWFLDFPSHLVRIECGNFAQLVVDVAHKIEFISSYFIVVSITTAITTNFLSSRPTIFLHILNGFFYSWIFCIYEQMVLLFYCSCFRLYLSTAFAVVEHHTGARLDYFFCFFSIALQNFTVN